MKRIVCLAIFVLASACATSPGEPPAAETQARLEAMPSVGRWSWEQARGSGLDFRPRRMMPGASSRPYSGVVTGAPYYTTSQPTATLPLRPDLD